MYLGVNPFSGFWQQDLKIYLKISNFFLKYKKRETPIYLIGMGHEKLVINILHPEFLYLALFSMKNPGPTTEVLRPETLGS